jgi:hypothetical protein
VNTTNFDVLTHIASRRGSLLALGGAGLTAALTGAFGAAPTPKASKLDKKEAAEAKKKRPKNAKRGDVNKLCKAQVRGCIDILTPTCAGNTDVEACVALVQRCCPELGTCDVAGFFTCLQANAS